MSGIVLLAHGSPDPRSAQAIRRLTTSVHLATGCDVRAAFLDHDAPDLTEAVAELAAGSHGVQVVVVPLLLSAGYHGSVDIPRAIAAAQAISAHRVELAAPVGLDARLVDHLDRCLPAGPVVLVHAPTRDPGIAASVGALADLLAARRGARVDWTTPSHLAQTLTDVDREARAGIGLLLLAPGQLADQVAAVAGRRVLSTPLAQAPEIVDMILERADAVRLQVTR